MTGSQTTRRANSAGLSAPSPHTVHVPVMGTGFTIDTPLRVARYGISSAISIGDDTLIEELRRVYSRSAHSPFRPIDPGDEDARASRITAYLNLVNDIVHEQTEALRQEPFTPESDLTRYFSMLPDGPLRQAYESMCATTDPEKRELQQAELRRQVRPGSIDVNIMTKVDRDVYRDGEKQPPEQAVAMSALRGYASSTLASAIVLSAGLNRRLYTYLAHFDDFFPSDGKPPKKKIILKVSDYRSALIQGKLLAKSGLWVHEFRVESGLNCGGHAFVGKGSLLGPVLDEFRERREELYDLLLQNYRSASEKSGREDYQPERHRITVQGGIGTAQEDSFLRSYYRLDGTGWGTPFLLVPEATNVDVEHLRRLSSAGRDDVYLSDCSPLGVPFWNLRNSASEETRKRRIAEGLPGSPCPKGYLAVDTEFTTLPLCRASRAYQRRKLDQLTKGGPQAGDSPHLRNMILSKSCLCLDLASGVRQRLGLDLKAQTAVCCGPGIAHFSRVMRLDEIIDHIYGRRIMSNDKPRSHMFMTELRLNLDYLRSEINRRTVGLTHRTEHDLLEFKNVLLAGIDYYRRMIVDLPSDAQAAFTAELDQLEPEFHQVQIEGPVKPTDQPVPTASIDHARNDTALSGPS